MGTEMEVVLEPGDIFLTRGKGFISRAIRFFTRRIGESRTMVNHVGIVVKGGKLRRSVVVEALHEVVEHPLWVQYGPPKSDSVGVFRATNLTEEEVDIVVTEARSQLDKKYGYLKIAAHLADWFLLGTYAFRRFTRSGRYPICSWLVAHAFAKAGKDFKVAPGAAQPDDIWDFIQKNQDIYEEVHPLQPLD
jgi:hypothetical protein